MRTESMRCAACGVTGSMPFTDANVPLCERHYGAWLRDEGCSFAAVTQAIGYAGTLLDATPDKRRAFGAELARRTQAWAATNRTPTNPIPMHEVKP